MATARTTALSALIATRRQDAWSDGVLKQYIARDALDRRDAALLPLRPRRGARQMFLYRQRGREKGDLREGLLKAVE